VFATLTNWSGLIAVLASETIRSVNGTGKNTAELRYFVSSARMPPDLLAAAIRRHWARVCCTDRAVGIWGWLA